MAERARVVVIGAGIVGSALAYHLARRGRDGIVVLDRGPLFDTGGSTGHAPGLVFQTSSSRLLTRLARMSVRLYRALRLDGAPGWRAVGGIEVATTDARLADLHRKLGSARSWGVAEAALITPAEVAARLPLIDRGRILGGLWVPGDGVADGPRLCRALARRAEATGAARFQGETEVTGFEVSAGRLRAVLTDCGAIETEVAVICAGLWSPGIGKLAGISVPLVAVEHQLARTTALPALAGTGEDEIAHPILRHQDQDLYVRQVGDRYVIGSYRHAPRLVEADDLGATALRPFTAADFAPAFAEAKALLPLVADARIDHAINGMFSFTPDGLPLLGPTEVDGLWLGAAVWVTHAGGAARALADWLVDGEPRIDLHAADANRFHAHQRTPAYVCARGAQQYVEVYDVIHPRQQIAAPRGLRLSPFQARLEALHPEMVEVAGWERPLCFAANEGLLDRFAVPGRNGWAARHWSPVEGAEHLATRAGVALFDLSPFVKIELSGPGAARLLQWLCASQIDRPPGAVVYTAMLGWRGGIMADLTVTRLAADRFLIVTGAATGMHDLAWIRGHAAGDDTVRIADVTSGLAALGLWGPKARAVLAAACPDDDMADAACPYLAARRLHVGAVPVRALRISYAGELGWELYAPTECALALWDALWQAGAAHGLVAAGIGALDSLRIEAGRRLWGADIGTDDDPYQAGLGFAVRLDKGDFLGRAALMRIRERRIARRLCCLALDDAHAAVMGGEPILDRGRPVGFVTSANFGYSTGRFIAYGWLPARLAAPGTPVTVEYFGAALVATVAADPVFDPARARVRG
ncbi:MAG TPA: FAD-dependent oxidoreductase [Alphaproteobacteria bacterium]